MFVSETTAVRLRRAMCLRAQRSDAIMYAFGRILSGINVATAIAAATMLAKLSPERNSSALHSFVSGRKKVANYGGSTAARHQRVVSGLFRDKHSAEQAYDLLIDKGYTRDETSVVMSEETRKKHFHKREADTEMGSKAMEGAGVGGAIGATIGGLLGALAAVGTSIALPGLGIVVAGPLIAALSGAGAGGVTGGLIGALVGSGIPEERAKHYEAGIKGGGILISVAPRTADEAEWIEREWRNLGGETAAR